MRALTASAALLALLVPGNAAAQVSMKAGVNVAQVNQPFHISVHASGERIEDVVLPESPGLYIRPTPISRSQSISIHLNETRITQIQTYEATIDREGTMVIPPAKVRIDGSLVLSNSITITVVKRREEPEAAAPGSTMSLDELVFLESEVNRHEAYQGQPIRLTLSVWRHTSPQLEVTGSPRRIELEGFVTVPQDPKELTGVRGEVRQRNGRQYRVREFVQSLVPTSPGEHTIAPWEWGVTIRVGMGFRSERYDRRLTTEPITVRIKPLPPAPAEFSGAVGQYTMAVAVTEDRVSVGSPLDLVVTITGEGNPLTIGEPTLPRIEGAYVSPPEKNEVIRNEFETDVQKHFIYTITPNSPGSLRIEPIQYCYFDPELGQFETIESGNLSISVEPGKSNEARITDDSTGLNASERQPLGDGQILPLAEWPGSVRPPAPAPGRAATAAAAGLPLAAYAAAALYLRRRERLSRNPVAVRRAYARHRAFERLHEVRRASSPVDPLYRALTGFVADAFGKPEAAITSADAQSLLHDAGLDKELVASYVEILRECERCRYGAGNVNGAAFAQQISRAEASIERIAEQLRRSAVS